MRRIVDAATNGIMRAISDHFSFSRKESLWKAPEYIFTASIYREIKNLTNPQYRVDMEDPIEEAIRDAGGWGLGQIPAAVLRKGRSRKGKFDIVLSDNKSHTPFAIIEVKKAAGPRQVKQDAERICAVLNRPTPTIQWGTLALVVPGQDQYGNVGFLKRRIKLFGVTVPTYVGDWKVSPSVRETEEVGNGRRYAAMVFKIGPRRSRA